MRPTEKRRTILLNGLWISILAIVGVAFFIADLGHLPLFWIGFVLSFAFGVCNTYIWYLEYRKQREAYATHVNFLTRCIMIGIGFTVILFLLLLFISPENIKTVILGLGAGTMASLVTGPFGVALFYSQSIQEAPAFYNPHRKEWMLPLNTADASFTPPIHFSERPADGIQRFPFHFVGYDLFFDIPYRTKHVRCRVCDTLCEVRRNVYGALNWKDYNREFYQWHDSFACPHTTTAWHNRALELVQQIDQTEQADFRQPLVEHLRVLLKESKYIRW